MDSNGNGPSRGTRAGKKPTVNTRRVWSNREEQVLLAALKELVSTGWKSDNGFRPGYLTKLLESIKKVYRHTDLVVQPNITSKLTTWKKHYGSIVSAQRNTTGVGWNTTTNTLEVNDEQWESIVNKDNTMKGMRYKEWPLFPDWLEIFGNDRATGAAAEDLPDAAAKMKEHYNSYNTQTETSFRGENFINLEDQTETQPEKDHQEDETDSSAYVTAPPVVPSSSNKRKRKTAAGTSDGIMSELLKELCRTTAERLEAIARRIGYDYDLGQKRAKVYEMLRDVPGMTTVQKLEVTQIIGSKVEILEIFLGLPESDRALYAIHLLGKSSG